MSFADFHRVIKENDTVILYNKINQLYALEVKPHITNRHGELVPNIFQTNYGALTVMSLVGRQFGCRVQLTKGWSTILYPTPELWTLTLPHRTQIIYSTDISMVIGRLNLGPGSIVCEAGTGSGSLSHAILRTIGPSGTLHTADFHEKRVEAAKEEFERHGLSGRVSCVCRDVIAEGWPVCGAADAVFMDLPAPWSALHHAVNAVKETGGRICSFSPCIEQVSRMCSGMRALGLQEVRTMEVLTRELEVKQLKLTRMTVLQEDPNLQHKRAVHPTEESSTKKLKVDMSDVKNGVNQESAAVASVIPEQQDSTNCNGEFATQLTSDAASVDATTLSSVNDITERKINGTEDEAASVMDTSSVQDAKDIIPKMKDTKFEDPKRISAVKTQWNSLGAVPIYKQAGHTGFLTFCIIPPCLPRPVKPSHLDAAVEETTQLEGRESCKNVQKDTTSSNEILPDDQEATVLPLQ